MGPTEEEFAVKADAVRAAERALSAKELQLANVMEELNSGPRSPMSRRLKSLRSRRKLKC